MHFVVLSNRRMTSSDSPSDMIEEGKLQSLSDPLTHDVCVYRRMKCGVRVDIRSSCFSQSEVGGRLDPKHQTLPLSRRSASIQDDAVSVEYPWNGMPGALSATAG